MKQEAMGLDLNYDDQTKKLDLNYTMPELDLTMYRSATIRAQKLSACSPTSVPGIKITCTMHKDSTGSDPIGRTEINLKNLGFKSGEQVDYLEMECKEGGGTSKGAIVMRTGFPY
jgi:hypothetical protein